MWTANESSQPQCYINVYTYNINLSEYTVLIQHNSSSVEKVAVSMQASSCALQADGADGGRDW